MLKNIDSFPASGFGAAHHLAALPNLAPTYSSGQAVLGLSYYSARCLRGVSGSEDAIMPQLSSSVKTRNKKARAKRHPSKKQRASVIIGSAGRSPARDPAYSCWHLFVPAGSTKTPRGVHKEVFQQFHKYCTPFQLKVFGAVSKIPFGETRSYKWVAEKIGRPKAARSVGQALKKNPLPIVVPCHRVINSDGSIGGYMLGTKTKGRLLELEKRLKSG